MIAAVDAHYHRGGGATAAVVVFRDWAAEEVEFEHREYIPTVEAYEPGNLYKRELPCLLLVLGKVPHRLDAIVVDGYVWLAPDDGPGLGAHLYRALGSGIPVVGVAKKSFRGAANAQRVVRGGSRRPLYVTAVAMDTAVAARHVAAMHGPYHIPTMLRRVDRLCRAA